MKLFFHLIAATILSSPILAFACPDAPETEIRTIMQTSSVYLTGKCVKSSVCSGGQIELSHTHVNGNLFSGGSIKLDHSTCDGILNAGGKVTLQASNVPVLINAGGSALIKNCETIGIVNAGGKSTISGCIVVKSISSGGSVNITNSKITGNVSSGGNASIQDSTIQKTLSCVTDQLLIQGSEIDTIRVAPDTLDGNTFTVELNNSTVHNIVFRKKVGEVILKNGATITGSITFEK